MSHISRDLRIALVGAPGALAVSMLVSRQLGIPRIRLASDLDRARSDLTRAASGPSWIIDGNGDVARELVWPRATTIVWLDFSHSLAIGHMAWRSLSRYFARERGSRGRRLRAHLDPRHAIAAAVRRHEQRRAEYRKLMDSRWVHLTSLADARDWLLDIAR